MEFAPHEESSFNPKQNVHNIAGKKIHVDNHLLSKYKIDENEKKLLDFFNSKLKAMEKIDLDDECFIEKENEAKIVILNKNEFRKSERIKSGKSNNSPNKKKSKKSQSKKKYENKNHKQNTVIKNNRKTEKYKMKSSELSDVLNFDVDKELKKKELSQFFSNQSLLNSIINELKD